MALPKWHHRVLLHSPSSRSISRTAYRTRITGHSLKTVCHLRRLLHPPISTALQRKLLSLHMEVARLARPLKFGPSSRTGLHPLAETTHRSRTSITPTHLWVAGLQAVLLLLQLRLLPLRPPLVIALRGLLPFLPSDSESGRMRALSTRSPQLATRNASAWKSPIAGGLRLRNTGCHPLQDIVLKTTLICVG
jgi:hypothetical protein